MFTAQNCTWNNESRKKRFVESVLKPCEHEFWLCVLTDRFFFWKTWFFFTSKRLSRPKHKFSNAFETNEFNFLKSSSLSRSFDFKSLLTTSIDKQRTIETTRSKHSVATSTDTNALAHKQFQLNRMHVYRLPESKDEHKVLRQWVNRDSREQIYKALALRREPNVCAYQYSFFKPSGIKKHKSAVTNWFAYHCDVIATT